MSMWEIEYVVEQTIKMINTSQATPYEKRNWIGNAYRIQDQFDCSFTHLRVKDILLKNEYIQPYSVKSFPLYNDNVEWFDKLVDQDFVWIRQNPQQKWAKDNLEVGYWDEQSQKIYVDFGTPYYFLHPTESLVICEPLAFSLSIIREVHKQENKSLLYN